MGKGAYNHPKLTLQEYSWEDIKRHNVKDDRWIVVEGFIYNVTNWAKRHPGGEKIIANYAGQDATEAWNGFHPDKQYVSKFMKPLLVGRIKDYHNDECVNIQNLPPILADFKKLRKLAEDMGLFQANFLFFFLVTAHILFLDFLGWAVMKYIGTGWVPYMIAALLLATSQIQAGWAQHDYGHLSVFRNSRWNHYMQLFLINFIKGASADWWNYRHFNHHAKPNIVRKDPDIRLDMFFLVGKVLPLEWAKKKKGFMPYNWQHRYFYLILPPLLLPLYFNYEIPYFLISRKKFKCLAWMMTFWVRWYLMFGPMLGFWGVVKLFILVRFFESHWFVWATQMSHLPRDVEYDEAHDWVTMQMKATCNVEQSWFNDWWSGHLNFQIEHHLFPTMPRHNLHKIAPFCKELVEKYGLEYQNKPLLKALQDITGSLQESGQMWLEAYDK